MTKRYVFFPDCEEGKRIGHVTTYDTPLELIKYLLANNHVKDFEVFFKQVVSEFDDEAMIEMVDTAIAYNKLYCLALISPFITKVHYEKVESTILNGGSAAAIAKLVDEGKLSVARASAALIKIPNPVENMSSIYDFVNNYGATAELEKLLFEKASIDIIASYLFNHGANTKFTPHLNRFFSDDAKVSCNNLNRLASVLTMEQIELFVNHIFRNFIQQYTEQEISENILDQRRDLDLENLLATFLCTAKKKGVCI